MGNAKDRSFAVFILVVVIAAAVGIGIGVLIGWYSGNDSQSKTDAFKRWEDALNDKSEDDVTQMIIDESDPENIRDFLMRLTSVPHLGGTPQDKVNAEYVRDTWIDQGLDSARIVKYDILLSYPRKENPNLVYLNEEDGTNIHTSAAEEAGLENGDTHKDTVPPFNAYAKAGNVSGDLMYVNYGRVEDFHQLTRNLSISVEDKIVIARYGKIFRGNKANNAKEFGAKGLILYSDPADYAVGGVTENDVYPKTWYLPGSGIQRGNVLTVKGDPLTQGYPATEDAYRIPEDQAALPNIPVQPIGYDDARHLLEALKGNAVPEGWAGSLENVTYRLGGLENKRHVRLVVNNYNEIRPVHNVFAIIKGSIEPDRYVVLGNHRDAWVFGSVDPSSGTSAMLELTRVFGKLKTEGKWRPRRSILFCSWGAEEYGLMGSYEWIEDYGKIMAERAIAYVNCDSAVSGNFSFQGRSTPNLHNVLYAATKRIPDVPFADGRTVYERWNERYPKADEKIPNIADLGSGSDFRPFLGRVGVSAIDIRYTYDKSLGISSYPLYHSMYETFFFMNNILDASFQHHLVMVRVWGEIARSLADTIIFPLDCIAYGKRIEDSINNLKELYAENMAAKSITFDAIDAAVDDFKTSATDIHARIADMDMHDPFAVRKMNDQLMLLERAFIDPLGLPGRPLERHVIFAPSSKNSYYGDAFPGIVDLMFDIDNAENPDAQWEDVRRYMSIVAYTLRSAADTLKEVDALA